MKPLSRRTLLKSVGSAIALPWLNAMAPAKSMLPRNWGATPVVGPKRLAFMYIPNGVIGKNWFPKPGKEKGFELPSSLQPLAKHRDDFTIISGLNRTHVSGEAHSQAGSCWLTSAPPNESVDGMTAINTTLDQIVARDVGKATPFSSLELSCNSFDDNMEPKIFDAISWYGAGNDATSENDPKAVFSRLFGEATHIKKSVLDSVLGQASQLRGGLGQEDRRKLDEYFESVRTIENRLQKQAAKRLEMGQVNYKMPEKIPTDRGEYIRLMGDLMVLALQTDQTRIATFMVGPERWSTPQLFDGVFDKPVNHHEMTHDENYDDDVAKIDHFHMQQYAYLIERMKAQQEGERTLLDNCYFVLGSGLGDGNSHSYKQLPVIIAGQGGESIQNGRHLTYAQGTPLANLWLTLAQKMGIPLKEFADSTGALSGYV